MLKLKKINGNIFKRIFIISAVLFIIFIIIGIGLLFVNIALMIFTGFGLALEFSNTLASNLTKGFMGLSGNILINIPTIIIAMFTILFYTVTYTFFIKDIYANRSAIKFFKENT